MKYTTTITISKEVHKKLMDRKNSTITSANAVIEKLLNPDDNDLIGIMNQMRTPFVCFDCGAECDDLLDGSHDVALGVLRFDNGSLGSREETPEPASFYFECINCYRNNKKED